MTKKRKTLEERFWEKVNKCSPDDCWEWIGCKTKAGYGTIFDARVHGAVYAHRLAYEMYNGYIPIGAEILHVCDNPACVNRKHLKAGTHKENMQDMASKKRNHPNPKKGMESHFAKISDCQIELIRNEYAKTNISWKSLAQKYGISKSHIGRILKNKSRIKEDRNTEPTKKDQYRNPLKGINNGRAVLSEQQVIQIREEYKNSNTTKANLARIYGVSDIAISHIINRKTWKHI